MWININHNAFAQLQKARMTSEKANAHEIIHDITGLEENALYDSDHSEISDINMNSQYVNLWHEKEIYNYGLLDNMVVTDIDENDAFYDDNHYLPDFTLSSPIAFTESSQNWQPSNHARSKPHTFNGDQGLTVDTTGFHPSDYFRLFITEELLNYLVEETNLFAIQYLRDYPKSSKYAKLPTWTPTTLVEIKKFIGLLLLMGIVHKPYISHYWFTDPLYDTPIFRSVMSCHRFQLLLKFFHFNDNDNRPEKSDPKHDRLYKIRPLIDHLFEYFQTVYNVGPDVAINESYLVWNKRLQLHPDVRFKRARFGIKLLRLCECNTGYTYRFKMYIDQEDPTTGIKQILPLHSDNLEKPEKLALFLLLPLLDQGYNVYINHCNLSVNLCSFLYSRKTNACGMLHVINAPEIMRNLNSSNQSVIAYRSGPLLCIKLQGKVPLYMLTTIHDEPSESESSQDSKTAPNRPQELPVPMLSYMKNMRNIDKQDQVYFNHSKLHFCL